MAQNNDRSSSEPLMGRAGNRVLWWILEAVGLSSLDLFTGFSGAIATVFPQADVQKCIVHQTTFPRRVCRRPGPFARCTDLTRGLSDEPREDAQRLPQHDRRESLQFGRTPFHYTRC